MIERRWPRPAPTPRRQRGQALLLTAVLVALGVLTFVLTTAGSDSVSIAHRQADNTLRTLAQVKAALIAWSAARDPAADGTNARPGELPCPDTDAPGTAGYGYDDGSCGSGSVAVSIGRVPWKTLGIPEPKDESGEILWYAVAAPFRNHNMSSAPITSDTLGNIKIYVGSTASELTAQAVAVIFAPGVARGSQDRDSATTMSCTNPSGTQNRNVCASNYLDTLGGIDNASPNSTNPPAFIQSQSPPNTTDDFNDRLLIITNADLMPLVERRVAREIISILQQYKVATSLSTLASLLPGFGVYPWADRSDGGANTGWNHNRFPCGSALPVDWGTVPTLGTQATPTLPNWLKNGCDCTAAGQRGWACVILYAVAKNKLQNNGLTPTACTEVCAANTLTITNPSSRTADVCLAGVTPFVCTPAVVGTISADLVLITSGAATLDRTGGWPNENFTTPITLYFEDSQNGANNSDTYVVPASPNNDRDRIFIIR